MSNEITKDDLVQAVMMQVVAMLVGLLLGALLVGVPVIATYPAPETCVMESNDE